MDLLTQLNSLPMFLIVGVVVAFIAVLCVVFLVRSWRAGVATIKHYIEISGSAGRAR